MADRYVPPSGFLQDIIAENVPLEGSEFAEANVRMLIALTRDTDRVNRDWATMLLAQLERNSPEVREALLSAAADEDEHVRGEAILGLAAIDPAAALPLIQAALEAETVCLLIFEAAAAAPHASLLEKLRDFVDDGEDLIDWYAREAFAACKRHGSTA